VSDITQDKERNIIYATTGKNKLHKVSNDGKIIKTVGRSGKRDAEFNFPNGLRVSKNDELYVCDSHNNRVQVFDLDLNFKRSFGKKGTGRGQFDFPADVDFDSRGTIYITDILNHRIQVFTCTECHIHDIYYHPLGQARDYTFRPVSLLVHDEKLYVTDSINHNVWVMNTSGETIATFGEGILRSPEGIAMDKDGFVYVTSHYSKIFVF
jgi:DNA-binding beta-propeller fold protein YncE